MSAICKMRIIRETDELLFLRYLKILSRAVDWQGPEGTTRERLIGMCNESINNISEWSIDKLNRWLGFIQGVMSVQELISVSAEREFSRPLFHLAYKAEGILVLETIERPANLSKKKKKFIG